MPPISPIYYELDDLKDIVSDSNPSGNEDESLYSVTVSGVQQLESVYSCISCKNTICVSADRLVACEQCRTTQKKMQCQIIHPYITRKHLCERLQLQSKNNSTQGREP